MMRIRWSLSANKAGLPPDECQVCLASLAGRLLGKRKSDRGGFDIGARQGAFCLRAIVQYRLRGVQLLRASAGRQSRPFGRRPQVGYFYGGGRSWPFGPCEKVVFFSQGLTSRSMSSSSLADCWAPSVGGRCSTPLLCLLPTPLPGEARRALSRLRYRVHPDRPLLRCRPARTGRNGEHRSAPLPSGGEPRYPWLAQTGQSEEIHSPDEWASRVVR